MPAIAQTMHLAPMSWAGLSWMSDSTRGMRNDKGETYLETFVSTARCTQTSKGRGLAFTTGDRVECARSCEGGLGVTVVVSN